VAEEVRGHVEWFFEGRGKGVGCLAETVEEVGAWTGFEGVECGYRVGLSEMQCDGRLRKLWMKEHGERKGG